MSTVTKAAACSSPSIVYEMLSAVKELSIPEIQERAEATSKPICYNSAYLWVKRMHDSGIVDVTRNHDSAVRKYSLAKRDMSPEQLMAWARNFDVRYRGKAAKTSALDLAFAASREAGLAGSRSKQTAKPEATSKGDDGVRLLDVFKAVRVMRRMNSDELSAAIEKLDDIIAAKLEAL